LWRRNIRLQVDSSNNINQDAINTIDVFVKNRQLIIENINIDYLLSIYTVQGKYLANYQLKRGEVFRQSLLNYPQSALILMFRSKEKTFAEKIINY
jgi:hypothetical protein